MANPIIDIPRPQLEPRQIVFEKIDGAIGRSVLMGKKDIFATRDIEIYPGHSQYEPAIVPFDIFPNDAINNLLDRHPEIVWFDVHGSTRSRIAQAGGATYNAGIGQLIAEYFENMKAGNRLDEIRTSQGLTVPLLLENFGTRPLVIPAGTGILNPYLWNGTLSGGELFNQVENKKIGISGVKGRDWEYLGDMNDPESIQRIEFLLDQQSIGWIPPHQDNTPIVIDDDKEYRKKINTMLEPIQASSVNVLSSKWQYALLICRTKAVLELDPSVHGQLDIGVDLMNKYTGEMMSEEGAMHIGSLAIKGGQTPKWPIILEIKTAIKLIKEGWIPYSVTMFFGKAAE